MPTIREKERRIRESLTKANRENLYEVSRFLEGATQERTGLRVRVPVYPKDPAVAAAVPELGLREIDVRWEPALGDGPTSARVAVVDYNADTGALLAPVRWDAGEHAFVDPDGNEIDTDNAASPQFHQVNVWAIVETVLEYFERGDALGRFIPWGFDGNRLIVVPHAGYDENAYYDRRSKSLQFYYFGDPDAPKFTCLSHDIVAHETGHAVLDGVRPFYNEHSSPQTAAFHEFVGDLTAMLLAFRNNHVRSVVAETVEADLTRDEIIADLAREFGETISDTREQAYLRTAHNELTLADLAGSISPHDLSQVLTGAMFDILTAMAAAYRAGDESDDDVTAPQALWWAIQRFGRVAVQPLDLCPPVDIQFVDYARAVIRNLELVDPEDERGFRATALEVFHRRGFCACGCAPGDHDPAACHLTPEESRFPRPRIYHNVGRISSSRTDAYHFLHDNRSAFRIPAHVDLAVVDLYETHKMGRGAQRLPVEVVVEYLWREQVRLEGPRFRRFEGRTTDLLCGGTLVMDDRGNIRSWFRKPGTEDDDDRAEGRARREALLDYLAALIAAGRIGLAAEVDGLGLHPPPVVARTSGGSLSLESSPHLTDNQDGAEPWTLSF